ncbi:helix-turn-helix domain-containing protein [Sinomonas albida]|uniref:helix-turn-helix domain-containing protein n=1 Tax=Sinomonas albida TaxID=369942 RepID=UPI00301743E2
MSFATSTGLASVSMSDIAREAEISPATAYRHFASVEEVLVAYRYGIGERLRSSATSRRAKA